jgi:hypothetical protein
MKSRFATKHLVYLLVILVSLAIFILAAISPTAFLNVNSVYQGF